MRALILKFGAIGDVIMLLPAAHALHLAGYSVDWVCGPTVLPLLQLYPWINAVPTDDRAILIGALLPRARAILALWRTLRTLAAGQPYDLAATLYYDPRYRLLALPIRARRKILLSWSDRAHRILPGRHHTDEFARILLNLPDQLRPTSLAPVPPPADALPPSPLPAPTRRRIVLAPAGATNMMAKADSNATLRRWPIEHFVTLATSLLARGDEVILIGGPDDTWANPHFAHLPCTTLIGALSLTQTIALLNASAAFISHDTGPLHLAGLSSAAIVAIFGPTDPHYFLPRRSNSLALWGGEGFACRPCYDGHSFAPCPANDCTRSITPQQVLAALNPTLHTITTPKKLSS